MIGLAAVIVFAAVLRMRRPDSPAYAGTPLDEPAADFQLTEHRGATVSLADWRGQVVVLTFFDSECKEVCPITAAELRAASQALGEDAYAVVFAGVNVNLQANQVADVAAATEQWRLDEIPSWRFLTGSAEELQPVWQAYDIAVMPANEDEGELLHTPGAYLIDQTGRKRWYLSVPVGDAEFTPLRELLVQHIQTLLSK
jgi:protein SCO1/2